MQVKVFEAEDMTSALKKVKAALGPDAIILSTRTMKRKGVGNLFARPLVEVTAAIEPPAARPRPGGGNPYAAAAAAAAPAVEAPPRRSRPVVEPLEQELQDLRRQLTEGQQGAGAEVQTLRQEIEQLKQLVQGLSAPTPAPVQPAPVIASRPARPVDDPSPLAEELIRRGVEAEAAETIAGYAGAQARPEQLADPAFRHRLLQQTIASLVQTLPPLTAPGEGQRRIALVGPTGVGKTTTIAKLAAAALQHTGQRVALITVDTYRIAAVEQLKVYGEIMELPVEVALTAEELQQAIARHRDKDLILIDTAGRSPRDAAQIDDLLGFLGEDSGIDNLLVLAAPVREREQERVLRRFSALPLSGLIVTKLDECEAPGALLTLGSRTGLPLACLANGQRVPEDLLPADPETVAELILSMDGDAA